MWSKDNPSEGHSRRRHSWIQWRLYLLHLPLSYNKDQPAVVVVVVVAVVALGIHLRKYVDDDDEYDTCSDKMSMVMLVVAGHTSPWVRNS